MREKVYLAVALLIYLLVVFFWAFRSFTPSPDEIEERLPKLPQISENLFQNPLLKELKQRKQFGSLPVVVERNQQGRSNPFAGL